MSGKEKGETMRYRDGGERQEERLGEEKKRREEPCRGQERGEKRRDRYECEGRQGEDRLEEETQNDKTKRGHERRHKERGLEERRNYEENRVGDRLEQE